MSIMLCNTNSIYLAYIDLTTDEKRLLLHRTDCGPRAWREIVAMRDRLALVVNDGAPFAAELAGADKTHDLTCAALDLYCRAHTLLAALSGFEHLGARVDAVRAALTFGGGLTTASYLDTATTAARNRIALPDVAEALRAMPFAEDTTAEDIAELFISGGEKVGYWMGKRDDAVAAANAARAAANGRSLLNAARALLVRLRGTIDHEVSWRDDLPDTLGDTIFSGLDGRIAAAVAASRGGQASGAGEDAVAALEAAEAAEAAAAAEAAREISEAGAEVPPAPQAPAVRPEGPDGVGSPVAGDDRGGSGPVAAIPRGDG